MESKRDPNVNYAILELSRKWIRRERTWISKRHKDGLKDET
jgi:hypothetical protein